MHDTADSRLEGLRLQDIVARTSHVKLRDTVKVLRALMAVSATFSKRPYNKITEGLIPLLLESATCGGEANELHSKPGAGEAEACNAAYDLLLDASGKDTLDNIFKLKEDPFYALRKG